MRRRDLRALLSEVVFFSSCLAGKSPRIDAAARFGMRHHIDETKLLMAALPARDEMELHAKLAGLHERRPLVSDNLNFRPMLEAGARADISRLNSKIRPNGFSIGRCRNSIARLHWSHPRAFLAARSPDAKAQLAEIRRGQVSAGA